MTWQRLNALDGSGDWLLYERADDLALFVIDGVSPPRLCGVPDDGDGSWLVVRWASIESEPIVGADPGHAFRVSAEYVLTHVDRAHHPWVRDQMTTLLRRCERTLSGQGRRLTDEALVSLVDRRYVSILAEMRCAWPEESWGAPLRPLHEDDFEALLEPLDVVDQHEPAAATDSASEAPPLAKAAKRAGRRLREALG